VIAKGLFHHANLPKLHEPIGRGIAGAGHRFSLETIIFMNLFST
jgi:hypothetical protein